jgi:hypothetical protein
MDVFKRSLSKFYFFAYDPSFNERPSKLYSDNLIELVRIVMVRVASSAKKVQTRLLVGYNSFFSSRERIDRIRGLGCAIITRHCLYSSVPNHPPIIVVYEVRTSFVLTACYVLSTSSTDH